MTHTDHMLGRLLAMVQWLISPDAPWPMGTKCIKAPVIKQSKRDRSFLSRALLRQRASMSELSLADRCLRSMSGSACHKVRQWADEATASGGEPLHLGANQLSALDFLESGCTPYIKDIRSDQSSERPLTILRSAVLSGWNEYLSPR